MHTTQSSCEVLSNRDINILTEYVLLFSLKQHAKK